MLTEDGRGLLPDGDGAGVRPGLPRPPHTLSPGPRRPCVPALTELPPLGQPRRTWLRLAAVVSLPSDPSPLPTSPWTRPQPPPPLQRVPEPQGSRSHPLLCAQHPAEQPAKGSHTALLLNDGAMSARRPPYCLPASGWTPGSVAHTGLALSPFPASPPTVPTCETLPRGLCSLAAHASVSDPCVSYLAVLLSHAWGSLVPLATPITSRGTAAGARVSLRSCLSPWARPGLTPRTPEPTAAAPLPRPHSA